MKFAVHQTDIDPVRDRFASEVIDEFKRHGHHLVSEKENINYVFNLVDLHAPVAYRRKDQQEFVVTFGVLTRHVSDLRSLCYTALVKTLSNLTFCVDLSNNHSVPEIYYITPEVGFVNYPFDPEKVYKSVAPVVSSHFFIRNQVVVNLPPSDQLNVHEVEQLKYHGRVLADMGFLPAPFPINELLSEDLVRHLYRLYEIKGLSYGNLSIRGSLPGINGNAFWMTARGVNKGNLKAVGKDILLVTGLNSRDGKMVVSVPPDYDPKVRVSVEAIEHYMIYSTFPKAGAVLHVHAWIDGVPCTAQNYPCGTMELAEGVIELLKKSDTPHCTAVGLKNHGLTVTGSSLKDIFKRIRNKLLTNIPMFE